MTRLQRDALGYLVIIGFCVLMLAWGIPAYTPPYPGYGASPALVPTVAVVVMLVMACLSLLFILLAAYLDRPLPPEEREYPEDAGEGGGFTQVGRVRLGHLAKIMIPSVLLVVLIDYIGYMLASLLFLFVLQYVVGSRNGIQATVVSVTLTAAIYAAMRYGFGVPVPGPQLF